MKPRDQDSIATGIEFHRRELAKIAGLKRRTKDLERKIAPAAAGDIVTSNGVKLVRESRGVVTALPTTPYHGQRIRFQVVEGVNWAFVYNANAASALKWEFDGGAWWTKANSGLGTALAVASFIDSGLGTLTLPAALGIGDYTVTGVTRFVNATAAHTVEAQIALGATTSSIQWLDRGISAGTDARGSIPITPETLTNIAAGATMAVQVALTSATATCTIQQASMAIQPVRVGG